MKIRQALSTDTEIIKCIYQNAFDESEADMVSNVAVSLLQQSDTISLVALNDNEVIGHVAFSPVFFKNKHFAYLLAPLAVLPDYQNKKTGTTLVEHGLKMISRSDQVIVFVYGDPAYYSRFGFDIGSAKRFIPPYPLTYPEGWQALGVNDVNADVAIKIDCVEILSNAALW